MGLAWIPPSPEWLVLAIDVPGGRNRVHQPAKGRDEGREMLSKSSDLALFRLCGKQKADHLHRFGRSYGGPACIINRASYLGNTPGSPDFAEPAVRECPPARMGGVGRNL